MKKMLAVMLALMSLLCAMTAVAQDAEEAPILTENGFELTKEYRWFVNQYRTVRGRTVTYYDDVYAYNHGEYYLTPFDSTVADEYFVKDENGVYHYAEPIVRSVLETALAIQADNYDGLNQDGILYVDRIINLCSANS